MRSCLLIPLLLILASCGAKKPAADKLTNAVESYRARIAERLPQGWSVTADRNTIRVRRWDLVELGVPAVNAPAGTEGPIWTEAWPYVIVLNFQPPITPAELQRRGEANARREEELIAFRVKLRNVPRKFDEYLPATSDEKKLVEQYRKAQKKLPYFELPTLFDDDCAVVIKDTLSDPRAEFRYVLDPEVKAECDAVHEEVTLMFRRAP